MVLQNCIVGFFFQRRYRSTQWCSPRLIEFFLLNLCKISGALASWVGWEFRTVAVEILCSKSALGTSIQPYLKLGCAVAAILLLGLWHQLWSSQQDQYILYVATYRVCRRIVSFSAALTLLLWLFSGKIINGRSKSLFFLPMDTCLALEIK